MDTLETRNGKPEWFRAGAITLFAIGAAAAFHWWLGGITRQTSAAAEPTLKVAGVDMGRQWASKSLQWTIGLENPTDEVVEIAKILPACRCSAIEPTSLSIAPGETASVDVTFDTRPYYPHLAQADSFDFEAGFAVVTDNSPISPFRLYVSGNIANPAAIKPFRLAFTGASSVISTLTPPTRRLHIRWCMPMRQIELAASDAELLCEIEEFFEGATEHFVSVTPLATGGNGSFEYDFSLKGYPTNGTALPPVVVSVVGEQKPDIQALPSQVDLGIHDIGSSGAAVVFVQSHSGTRFTIDAAYADMDHVTADWVRDGQAAVHRIALEAKTTRNGLTEGTLIVELKGESGPAVVRVPIFINGKEPASNGE